MRTTPAISRAVAALILCLVAVVLTPAPATAHRHRSVPPAVQRIDRQIVHAQHEIDRWNRRLAHWQVRVSKAAARLQEIEASPPPPPPPPPTYFTARMTNYRPPPQGDPLVRAHRRLQQVLRDHRAKEAQQQSAAWQGFVGELRSERRRAIAAARHHAVVLASGPVTFQGWAGAFLAAIGAPACSDNQLVVVTWETAESTLARYNPLATTYDMAGATSFNTTGVKDYRSLGQGLDASRGTLEGGADSYGYAAVVRSLRACAPASVSARAIRDSAWCRGCGGGVYVLGLLDEVRGSWADHAARLIATT